MISAKPVSAAIAAVFAPQCAVVTMSYEPRRTKAYDGDLRWRMVYQVKVLQYNLGRVSANLGVSHSTVRRMVRLFDTTGNVDGRGYGSSHPPTRLTSYDEWMIMELVLEQPGIYLLEICRQLSQFTGTEVSEATVCRFLKKAGFTRTKIQLVAIQQSEVCRARYMNEMQQYAADMIVFLDETGSDRRDSMRKFGYSLRGKRTKSHRLLIRGRRVSAISAMSTYGMLDFRLVHGSVDASEFRVFVEENLLRHLMPFNGTNPHSIVVLDNASIHYAADSIDLIESIGALVIFLCTV